MNTLAHSDSSLPPNVINRCRWTISLVESIEDIPAHLRRDAVQSWTSLLAQLRRGNTASGSEDLGLLQREFLPKLLTLQLQTTRELLQYSKAEKGKLNYLDRVWESHKLSDNEKGVPGGPALVFVH